MLVILPSRQRHSKMGAHGNSNPCRSAARSSGVSRLDAERPVIASRPPLLCRASVHRQAHLLAQHHIRGRLRQVLDVGVRGVAIDRVNGPKTFTPVASAASSGRCRAAGWSFNSLSPATLVRPVSLSRLEPRSALAAGLRSATEGRVTPDICSSPLHAVNSAVHFRSRTPARHSLTHTASNDSSARVLESELHCCRPPAATQAP
jgi:hypothetical protein